MINPLLPTLYMYIGYYLVLELVVICFHSFIIVMCFDNSIVIILTRRDRSVMIEADALK